MRLQEQGRIVFSAAIDGAVYAKHGTTIDTRLTVIDRVPADDSASFPASPGIAPDLPTLLGWVDAVRAATSPDRWHADGGGAGNCRHLNAPNRPRLRQPAFAGEQSRRQSISWRPKSPTSRSTGCPRMPARSPMRFMRAMPCSRSAFPARRRIPLNSCSRQQWLPSRRQSRPIGRICRPMSCGWHPLGRPARERHLCRRGAFGFLAGSWTVDATFDVVAAAPDDARMPFAFAAAGFWATAPARARAGRSPGSCSTTGCKGRRARGLDQQIRQADRGCAARLVGARHGAAARHAAFALPAGHADPARGRRPIYHLRYAAHRRARRKAFARPADRRMVGLRIRRSDRLRREPRHAERGRRQGRTRRPGAPLSRGARACGSSTPCRTPASSTSPRPALPPCTISPMPSGSDCGAARISRSPPGPNSSRRSRRAVSRRWRCWHETSRRSASTRRARCPTRASNTNLSSTSSRLSRFASMTPMPAHSRHP